MESRIGHLHCNYRVIGSSARRASTTRLDSLTGEHLANSCAEALEHALGDDTTVYVVRSLNAETALNFGGAVTDERLAKGWGRSIARATVREIVRHGDDGSRVVRFESQSKFVARFAADLVRGRAWQHWYFGAFRELESRSTSDALRTVLLNNRDSISEVLGHLAQDGALDDVVRALDDSTSRLLWIGGSSLELAPGAEHLRPLLSTALDLVDRLGLKRGRGGHGEALLDAYSRTGPPAVDWSDRRDLARGVLNALSFVVARGGMGSIIDARLDEAMNGLDWLDRDWLQDGIRGLLTSDVENDLQQAAQFVRGPTPRQQDVLTDLARALRRRHVTLDADKPEAPDHALRVLAALVAEYPRWADEATVRGLIQRVIAGWSWLARSEAPSAALRLLGAGDSEGALRTLRHEDRARASGALNVIADLGSSAIRVLEPLVEDIDPSRARARPRGEFGELDCAGVFLLLRALLDASVPTLVSNLRITSASPDDPDVLTALIATLGARWGGLKAVDAETDVLDMGPRLLAGAPEPLRVSDVRGPLSLLGPSDLDRFQVELLSMTIGQRLVERDKLHLHRIDLSDGHTAIVAGDAARGVWPMGSVLDGENVAEDLIAQWLQRWTERFGESPAIVCDASLGDAAQEALGRTLRREPGQLVRVAAKPDEVEESPTVSTHRAGSAALTGGLGALDHLRIGVPTTDLTLDLTAITMLRLWARWLRGYSTSSVPFLLDSFIRRPGRYFDSSDQVEVELRPGPLDVVLEIAGYTDDIEAVPWLGDRRVSFRMRS